MVDLAAERFTKNLWTERQSDGPPRLVTVRSETDQTRYVIEQVLERREAGTALKQQAVLFRISSHSGALEVEQTRRNIPYVKFGGLKFLDAAHVKDLMALLRFVENPRDRVVGFRVMQLLLGVGPVSAQRVLDHITATRAPIAALPSAPPAARVGPDWAGFLDLVADLARGDLGWPGELERARQWYEPHLDRIHEDGEIRLGDLLQLEQIAAGHPSRERFLTELTLDPPDATSDQSGVPLLDEDYLIHSAKGQEWTSVFVLNAVDGCMPSDLGTGQSADIEEERRLLYVAMTRAKDDLHIMLPQRFFVHGRPTMGDRHVYASRTRFIPKGLLDLFETTSWPLAEPTAAAGPAQPPRVDVGERLRGLDIVSCLHRQAFDHALSQFRQRTNLEQRHQNLMPVEASWKHEDESRRIPPRRKGSDTRRENASGYKGLSRKGEVSRRFENGVKREQNGSHNLKVIGSNPIPAPKITARQVIDLAGFVVLARMERPPSPGWTRASRSMPRVITSGSRRRSKPERRRMIGSTVSSRWARGIGARRDRSTACSKCSDRRLTAEP